MQERWKRFFDHSLGYLSVALVSAVYVLAGVFVPGLTGKSIYTIIAEGMAGFVLGVAINYNVSLQGILKGKSSDQMLATRTAHAEAVKGVSPYIEGLDAWCDEQNAEKLKRVRAHILSVVGVHYEKCFDAEGRPLNPSFGGMPRKRRKECQRAYLKALRTRITPLSTSSLTCDGEKIDDPFDFGMTPAQYQRRTNLTDVLFKFLMAAVFGYFGVDMVDDFDVAALAWRALYVALLLALGAGKHMKAYLFVTDTYRGGIIKKINYLQAYENCAQELARQKREEKGNVEQDVRSGSVQDGRAKAAGGEKAERPAGGGHQPPKAVKIYPAEHQGVQPRHDGEREDLGEQRIPEADGRGRERLRSGYDGSEQLRSPRAGALGRQGEGGGQGAVR